MLFPIGNQIANLVPRSLFLSTWFLLYSKLGYMCRLLASAKFMPNTITKWNHSMKTHDLTKLLRWLLTQLCIHARENTYLLSLKCMLYIETSTFFNICVLLFLSYYHYELFCSSALTTTTFVY